MYIETNRMVIRDFTMDDLNDLHNIFGDAETMKNCEPAYTIEKTADFLQKFCIDKKALLLLYIKRLTKSLATFSLRNAMKKCMKLALFITRIIGEMVMPLNLVRLLLTLLLIGFCANIFLLTRLKKAINCY